MFNPFSGVLKEDIDKIIVPCFNVEEVFEQIENSTSLAIEFIGRQGRGKTTHLKYLQNQIPHYPIFLLDGNDDFSEIIQHKSEVVFVDSIHHLSLTKRIKLFKRKRVVIYTTHWNRKFECLIAKKKRHCILFKGIDSDKLKELLNKRLQLAAATDLDKKDLFTIDATDKLIKTYSDNYRGIINHLYEKFQ
ncbi:conserved protein of unknown function [Tenacibaculum sp. 190524A02b]|uniref:Uncharacterized protein n=2 Tax=Tenacibaculum vairaonense TaxID=3137860 RepID=A0ABP1FDN8_9FLAO